MSLRPIARVGGAASGRPGTAMLVLGVLAALASVASLVVGSTRSTRDERTLASRRGTLHDARRLNAALETCRELDATLVDPALHEERIASARERWRAVAGELRTATHCLDVAPAFSGARLQWWNEALGEHEICVLGADDVHSGDDPREGRDSAVERARAQHAEMDARANTLALTAHGAVEAAEVALVEARSASLAAAAAFATRPRPRARRDRPGRRGRRAHVPRLGRARGPRERDRHYGARRMEHGTAGGEVGRRPLRAPVRARARRGRTAGLGAPARVAERPRVVAREPHRGTWRVRRHGAEPRPGARPSRRARHGVRAARPPRGR